MLHHPLLFGKMPTQIQAITSLLICQVLGAVPLLVTIPLAIETHSTKFGSSLGFLHGSGTLLVILLEVPILSIAYLLETGGLINHQHLMHALS